MAMSLTKRSTIGSSGPRISCGRKVVKLLSPEWMGWGYFVLTKFFISCKDQRGRHWRGRCMWRIRLNDMLRIVLVVEGLC